MTKVDLRSSASIESTESLKPVNKKKKKKSDDKKKQKVKKNLETLTPTKNDEVVVVEPAAKEEVANDSNTKGGHYVNLSKLLFAEHRDYALKFNGDKVKAEDLEGKVVIIYFGSISSSNSRPESLEIQSLFDLYAALQHKNVLEIVWVPIVKKEKIPEKIRQKFFENKFATMPWPCIPHMDLSSRRRVLTEFSQEIIHNQRYLFIIDPTGKVLNCDANALLLNYGVEAFPFTDEIVQSINFEDRELSEQMSLVKLLTTRERNYLISSKGEQVPIRNIEDKVVALYFYEDGHMEKLTKRLKRVYRQLEKRKVAFEVVLVYLYDTWNTCGRLSQDAFNERFKNMPWLALPFRDPTCKKIQRIFGFTAWRDKPLPRNPDPSLVIIGPQGKFIGRFGSDILMNYGVEAFPFTQEKVLELEVEKLKKLDPHSLLQGNINLRKDESEINVTELMKEKRVLLIIEDVEKAVRSTKFLAVLQDKYLQKKGTEDEFEVIHIFLTADKTAYKNEMCREDFPWLPHYFDNGTSLKSHILERVFMSKFIEGTAIVAFERGGMLVAKEWSSEFEGREDMNFPFVRNLEKQMWDEMNRVYNFD